MLADVGPAAAAEAATSTTLTLSTASATFGAPVDASVVIDGDDDAMVLGMARILDGAQEVARFDLWNGQGSARITLARGNHQVTAEYLGRPDHHAGSTSAPQPLTVTKAPTSISFSTMSSTPVGYPVDVNVSAHPPSPYEGATGGTGTITLTVDGVEVGQKNAQWWYAEFDVVFDEGGEHVLTATYSGDENFDGSSGQTVYSPSKYSSTATIGSSFGASSFDCPPPNPAPDCTKSVVQGTGTVSLGVYGSYAGTWPPEGVTPTGTASFYFLGGALFAQAPVANSGANVSIASLPIGRHSMYATYSGDDAFGTGKTGVITFDVKSPPRSGYWMVGDKGTVYAFGQARSYGNASVGANHVVDIETTPDFNGYWILDDSGLVQAFGRARNLGRGGGLTAGERFASLSATPSGNGYWLFTTKGRALAFGDAVHRGDMAGRPLNGPVLDSIRTPSGKGYYMVASDGGIFAFGDAQFFGSMGGKPLNAPVRSLVPDPDGNGYWLVAGDGGVFAFRADFRGSMGGKPLNRPMVGMVPYGNGYLMVASDGGIFAYSDKPFFGSLGNSPPAIPIVAVAALDE